MEFPFRLAKCLLWYLMQKERLRLSFCYQVHKRTIFVYLVPSSFLTILHSLSISPWLKSHDCYRATNSSPVWKKGLEQADSILLRSMWVGKNHGILITRRTTLHLKINRVPSRSVSVESE